MFSSDTTGNNKQQNKQQSSETAGDDDETSKEIVLTPGQKVVAATRLGMWLGIAVFASGCAYFIAKELFPT